MKIFSQQIILGRWISWSRILGNFLVVLALFFDLQEAKADVNFCLQALDHSSKESPLKNEIILYLKKFNTALTHWQYDKNVIIFKRLQDISAELDNFISRCSGSPDLSQAVCQVSKKKLDSVFAMPSVPCLDFLPLSGSWYQKFYSSFSSQLLGYFKSMKRFFWFSKQGLTPLMLASCLENKIGLMEILRNDSKSFYKKDRHGKTIFHYVPRFQKGKMIYFDIYKKYVEKYSEKEWLTKVSGDAQFRVDIEYLKRSWKILDPSVSLF